jgi:hypothetical protein
VGSEWGDSRFHALTTCASPPSPTPLPKQAAYDFDKIDITA